VLKKGCKLSKKGCKLSKKDANCQKRDANCQKKDANCQKKDANCQKKDANCQKKDANCQKKDANCQQPADHLRFSGSYPKGLLKRIWSKLLSSQSLGYGTESQAERFRAESASRCRKPGESIQTRSHLAIKLLPQLVQATESNVSDYIEKADKIALTLDIWTDRHMHCFTATFFRELCVAVTPGSF